MADPTAKPGKRAPAVHIDADEVHVESAVEVPTGHVIVEPPTAATPAVARPSTDVRDAVVATELETSLRTEGQRAVSALWESTQTRLALLTVAGFMAAHVFVVVILTLLMIMHWKTLSEFPALVAVLVAVLTGSLGAIASMASLVIAAYFHRTNSSRIGGVSKGYEGR